MNKSFFSTFLYSANLMFLKLIFSSYLHCEWGTADQLAKKDKRVHAKVKRYKQKRDTTYAILNEVCCFVVSSTPLGRFG